MKVQYSLKDEVIMSAASSSVPSDLGAIADGHIEREFADQDVEATMNTMIDEPYVHCVPIMTAASADREFVTSTAGTS
jgi:hypothetical protein